MPNGRITWVDLTVPEADSLRAFYERVAGWSSSPVDMGGYSDYEMLARGTEEPVAGICHAKGVNAKIPAAWMIYITVGDLDESLAAALALGGEVLDGPREMGPTSKMAIVRDPAGAVFALFQE